MSDRITQIEGDIVRLNEAGRCVALGGLETIKGVQRIEATVACNTASIESFERTIADMQAQIDELKAVADDN